MTTTNKLRRPDTFRLQPGDLEKVTGVSLTVPDDSFSVREILEKYTRGIDFGLKRNGIYEDDADFDDYDKEKLSQDDLVDQSEALVQSEITINDYHEKVKRSKEASLKAKQDAIEQRRRKAELEDEADEIVEPEQKKRPKKAL